MREPFVKESFGKGRPTNIKLQKRKEEIDSCIVRFIRCEEAPIYSFENEQPNEYDCEASFLSRSIFRELFSKYFGEKCKINDVYETINYIEISTDDGKSIFHFDIMNSFSKGKIGNNSKILSKKISDDKYDRIKEVYRSIGNITAIPWPQNGNVEVNAQKIHAAFDDRWCLFLDFYKHSWSMFQKTFGIHISFVDYIISTCQQLYCKPILEDLKLKIKDKNITDIGDDEYINWMNGWNDILKNQTFDIIDYGTGELTDDKAEEMIDDILLIIEIRARCIIAILRSTQ